MTKVLMIEDDGELAEILTEYLAGFDINVTNIEDPYLGLATLATGKFDLVILDLTLPGMDGLEVCKEINEKYSIPIIISSARSDINDKVIGLELGADDYLPKPYDPRELEARIRTVLRRKRVTYQEEEKQSDIEIDEKGRVVKHKGEELQLTAAEFGILAYLAKRDGSVVSRSELILNVKEINEESTNKSIDVIIGRIRHKLNENAKNPKHIISVRGMGYKFLS